jgi:hypothetical protein
MDSGLRRNDIAETKKPGITAGLLHSLRRAQRPLTTE